VVSLAFVVAQSASLSDSLTPLYYAIGILLPIIGGLWALKRYADNQRQQNVQQGVREGQLVDRLDANTKAAEKNTASIEKLGEKFDSFSSAIDKRLTLADYRLDKLEEKIRSNGLMKSHITKRDDDV
jgi:hypothetical protein